MESPITLIGLLNELLHAILLGVGHSPLHKVFGLGWTWGLSHGC
jgi:hypothetical protein